MINFINLFIKGIFVGIANIIPGVSGGTIAVVLNIFDKIIEAINNFTKKPKEYIAFLFPILFGAVIGIFLFSKIINFLLTNHSLPTNMFFTGLVIGSIPLIYSQARSKHSKPIYYLATAISFIIVVVLSLINVKESSIIIKDSFLELLKILIFGAISSAAMIIPGISGSLVMILLGVYNLILTSISGILDAFVESIQILTKEGIILALNNFFASSYFKIVLAFGIGIIIGIILISKIIEILLKKFPSLTYFSILGLILGTIFTMFNDSSTYQSYSNNIGITSIIISIITIVLGMFISFNLSEKKHKPN